MASTTLRQRRRTNQETAGFPTTTREDEEHELATTEDDSSSHTPPPTTVVTPLQQRPAWMRLDVLPFALSYIVLVGLDQLLAPQYRLLITITISVTLLVQLAVVLASTWSVRVCAVVGFTQAQAPLNAPSSSRRWTHALVDNRPDDQIGIVSLQATRIDGLIDCKFHESVFLCDAKRRDLDRGLWRRDTKDDSAAAAAKIDEKDIAAADTEKQSAPIHTSTLLSFRPRFYPTRLPLSFYSAWKGHASQSALATAWTIYGPNTCALQPPSFLELLSQQVVAPLFLFQLLCVGLWCLDEYWYYAIYTLVALLLFEATMAFQRQASLQKLNRAGNSGSNHRQQQRVYVRRPAILMKPRKKQQGADEAAACDNSPTIRQWTQVYTHELLPGDIISLCCQYQHRSQQQATNVVPADVLLLAGTAVCDEALLTGESVPQLKHALEVSLLPTATQDDEPRLDMSDKEHKESVLFAGTVLIAATNNNGASSGSDSHGNNNSKNSHDAPPDQGVVGIVLRTGFETTQGSLLRTMAYSSSSSKTSATNIDTFIFIFLLLCCAIVAAALVLYAGWNDERRNRFRLLLHVVIIITSVVPPELPMELSLAVTNSVAALMHRCQVYCTDLHRIPMAGEVDVCVFDKTGTLTSDEMLLKGVCLIQGESVSTDIMRVNVDDDDNSNGHTAVPEHTVMVMAACHSLATVDGGMRVSVVGDPLERVVLKETGYKLINNDTVVLVDTTGGRAQKAYHIVHRYAFSSKLKRMTTLVTENEGQGVVYTLSKGAPETIKDMLKDVPIDYDETAQFHMRRGRRVLAMAYGEAGKVKDLRSLKSKGRENFERQLIFAGFLILDCPLKPDSKAVVTELRKSGHSVLMCTGDALLTAVEVARQVSIVKKKHIVYNLQKRVPVTLTDPLAGFEFVALDQGPEHVASTMAVEGDVLGRLHMGGVASFCITGDILVEVANAAVLVQSSGDYGALDEKHILLHPAAQTVLSAFLPLISVFARHAPHHKEAVIAALNRGGHCTLMCGDGTNDVGALKRAMVGISIVSAPEVESKHRHASEAISRAKNEKNGKGRSKQKRAMDDPLHQLREAEAQLNEVELGDASVAAPFTSKAVSIKCCKDVIQQGRCTLVTMLTIYKILGVNCLVNAMVLSKLFLNGVKQGDRQMTILGIVVVALFYFVTRADPLPTLSTERPPSSIMCLSALLSIFFQCAIHCLAIAVVTDVAMSFVDPFDPSLVPDGAFNANPLNTTTFLFTCLATINTFAVNYRGRPFMANLVENKLLYRSLQVCYGTLFVLVSECFPPLNDLFQLSQLPTITTTIYDFDASSHGILHDLAQSIGFSVFFGSLMVLDTALVFAVERLFR